MRINIKQYDPFVSDELSADLRRLVAQARAARSAAFTIVSKADKWYAPAARVLFERKE